MIYDTVKTQLIKMYSFMKDEILNIYNGIRELFNGNIIKNLFDAGYKFIMGSSMDESTQALSDRIDRLMEYVKKLKKTIESSKKFIHILIEKIRDQGRLKIVNKLNHNPKHPEYESTFPELDIEIPEQDNFKIQYPEDMDEDFNESMKLRTVQVDQKFKNRMNRSIEKSHYNYFINNKHTWTVFEQPSIPSPDSIPAVQDVYEKLEIPKELDEYFMEDFHSAVFFIDGHLITSSTKEEMMHSFKKLITNETEQRCISKYANPKLLKESYLKLIDAHPELDKAQITHAQNLYEITHLGDGTIRIICTNISDFYSTNENDLIHHHSFGVKTSIIFSYRAEPIIKHSYFVN